MQFSKFFWQTPYQKHALHANYASYNMEVKHYRTREIFGGGNFWQTMQVKAIGEEKIGE